MRYKKTLIFSFMITTLILGLIPQNVNSALLDITYNFKNDILYSNDDPDFFINKLSNVKNSSTFTGLYNASYSFTNEIDGTNSTNIDYIDIDNSAINTGVIIIDTLDNHDKVIEFFDNNNGGVYDCVNDFTSQVSGTIEWFWRTTDSNQASQMIFRESTTRGPRLQIDSNNFQYYDGGFINIVSASSNTWYHIRLDFECSGVGYLGLAPDTFFITINGIQYGAFDFNVVTINIDNIWFTSLTADTGYSQYFDAIGYSWLSNYTINNNFIPILETNELIKEVDRWEFAYSTFETLYPIGSDTFSDWTEIDTGNDLVNIKANADWSGDRLIAITHQAITSDTLGIEREFSENGNIFNITWAFELIDSGNPLDEYEMKVYSSDDTLISDIYFETNQLRYNLGGVHVLWSGYTENEYYELNLYINYNDELSVLRFYIDGVFEEAFNIPLIANGKEGLGKIENWLVAGVADDHDLDIDYIGVYNNNTAISTEFGHVRINDIVPTGDLWLFNEFNLVNFDMIADSSIWISEDKPYIFGLSIISEIALREVYSTPDTVNVYGLDDFHPALLVQDPSIWFQFYNQFQFNEISINGVKLIEGLDEHILEFTFGNVDPNESYFYVDTNNRLQFRHIADDSNLEYIQAEFNINDLLSTDYAIIFSSNIDDKAFGYFRVNFTDISNFIPIPIFDTITRVFITQDKTIRSIIILITDENLDTVSGLTKGYVSDIELLFVSGIGVSIITSNLLTVIIPLIIIFIPTFLLSSRVGKNMIVPLMMLMSLICVATEIIPIWLFFVIIFPSSLFLFLKRKELM